MSIDQPIVTGEPDAELMRLIAEFETTHRAYHQTSKAYRRVSDHNAAMPDCPPEVRPIDDRAAHKRNREFMNSNGALALWNESSKLIRFAGALANQIFSTPAETLVGAVEKLKIVRLQRGDAEGNADDDLAAFMDLEDPWFASVMKDLERLSDTPA